MCTNDISSKLQISIAKSLLAIKHYQTLICSHSTNADCVWFTFHFNVYLSILSLLPLFLEQKLLAVLALYVPVLGRLQALKSSVLGQLLVLVKTKSHHILAARLRELGVEFQVGVLGEKFKLELRPAVLLHPVLVLHHRVVADQHDQAAHHVRLLLRPRVDAVLPDVVLAGLLERGAEPPILQSDDLPVLHHRPVNDA